MIGSRGGAWLWMLSLPLVLGCAAPGSSLRTYSPPTNYQVKNELTIARPSDEVWDKLVGQLAKSFYVINNIDKASRIINLSFSSKTPELYLDCGQVHRDFECQGEKATYDYELAASSSYKQVRRGTGIWNYVDTIDRSTSLEGRVNIYVAPDSGGTRISVNAKYSLSLNSSGMWETRGGLASSSGPIPSETKSISLSTLEASKDNVGTPSNPIYVNCQSKGKLEQDILNFAR